MTPPRTIAELPRPNGNANAVRIFFPDGRPPVVDLRERYRNGRYSNHGLVVPADGIDAFLAALLDAQEVIAPEGGS